MPWTPQTNEWQKQKRAKDRATANELRSANRANFETGINTSTNFSNFEDHPETAALLCHVNSGHNKFRMIHKLSTMVGQDNDLCETPECKELIQEIRNERLSTEELDNLVHTFATKHGIAPPRNNNDNKSETLFGMPSSVDSHHLMCGMCGVTHVHGRFGQKCSVVLLKDMDAAVKLSPDEISWWTNLKTQSPLVLPVNEDGELGEFFIHKLHSIHDSIELQESFHLHPESIHTVTGSEATVLCHNCTKWHKATLKARSKKPPPNSVGLASKQQAPDGSKETAKGSTKKAAKRARRHSPPLPEASLAAGLDFGDSRRLKLEPLSPAEKMLLAKVRHCNQIIKVHGNRPSEAGQRIDGTKCKIRASSITFPTDSPTVASISLMHLMTSNGECWEDINDVLKKHLSFQIVGPKGTTDPLLKSAKKSSLMKCRPHVLFQWLAILQCCHKDCGEDPKLPTGDHADFKLAFQNLKTNTEQIAEALVNDALHITDETAINADMHEGDDHANVRTHFATSASSGFDMDSSKTDHIEITHTLISRPATKRLHSSNC